MTHPPSGEQHELRHGDQLAVAVEVGGGLRLYEAGGRPVIEPYGIEERCEAAHGAPLIPWPNRLAGGHYSFGGAEHQVPINEVDKQNAIHGLLRWRNWSAERRSDNEVILTTRLHPMEGYPFFLEVSITYRLSEGGLEVTTRGLNLGDGPLPYGTGQHPYLSPGEGTIDTCRLQLQAAERLLTDPTHQLPVGTEPVAGSNFDFAEGRLLGSIEIDHAFTGLARDADGRDHVHLERNDGRTVSLWLDQAYPFVQLYTGDTLAPGKRRQGLGAEPMTCPPDAFNSGEHLVVLQPGQEHTGRFGIRLSD